MAVNVLDEISKSEQDRIQYENELIFDLDIRSNIEGAKRERDLEIAKNFLRTGLPIEQISKGTGLSIEDIKKLKNQ